MRARERETHREADGARKQPCPFHVAGRGKISENSVGKRVPA